MENFVPTSHPVDPSDPVILSKSPDESASSFRNSHFALRNSLFPAPTTDLDGLHELLASTQCITQRWLDKAKTKDEPPSIADIANLTLSTRRIALLHRDIYRLENPGLCFPSPKKSSPTHTHTHTHTQADDPASDDCADSSELHSSNFTLQTSPTPTYPREISRYVAASIVKSIKSKPEDAADCCPDLYEEMDLMKSNPAYHAETLADFHSTTATPDPADPGILSSSESSPTHTPTQADKLPSFNNASASSFRNSPPARDGPDDP